MDAQTVIPELPVEEMRANAADASRLLKALANENRLMVLCHLLGRELSVSELNSHMDLSQSALSQHLAVLRRDGLVKTRRQSQTIYYSLADDRAARVLFTLRELFCPGQAPQH